MIDKNLLDEIADKAKTSPRLRMNYNIHESLDSPCQRLINVLIPGTVLPIHRHRHTAETYILLRGKMFVVFYDSLGVESNRFLLDPSVGHYGVNIPAGQWHTVEIIEPSAIFEVKEGPYKPLDTEDIMF